MHFSGKHRSCNAFAVHRVECRHQPEIEVWPAWSEAYFLDERYVDAASTHIRFDAVVYNTPSRAVAWQVQDVNGAPGAGTIDGTGLYTAPNKNGLPSGTTEIVVATAVDDPLRKAFARVTLIGRGPAPTPEPRIEIVPKQAFLYFQGDPTGNYIDWSNRIQLFRVEFHDTPEAMLEWTIRMPGAPDVVRTPPDPWLLYQAPVWPGQGFFQTEVTLTAALRFNPGVKDTAKVVVHKYVWPPVT